MAMGQIKSILSNWGSERRGEKLAHSRIRTPDRTLRFHTQIAVWRLLPVISDQDANRPVINIRKWQARIQWRPGRKWFDTYACTEGKRWACLIDLNRRMARSRARVGWCEFSARLFSNRPR